MNIEKFIYPKCCSIHLSHFHVVGRTCNARGITGKDLSWPQRSTVSRDTIVSVLIRKWVGQSKSRIPVRVRNFSRLQNLQINSGFHPVTYSIGTIARSRRLKGQRFKLSDHQLPSRSDVKNEQSYTSPHPICLRGVEREDFTFFLEMQVLKVVAASFKARKL